MTYISRKICFCCKYDAIFVLCVVPVLLQIFPYCIGETIEFFHSLSIFATCTVKIYNYGNVNLKQARLPVLIGENKEFRIDESTEFYNRLQARQTKACVAIVYLLPTANNQMKDNEGNGKKSKKAKKKSRRRLQKPMKEIDTKLRYDILVDRDKRGLSSWIRGYMMFNVKHRNTYGLILDAGNNFGLGLNSLEVGNQIQIINRMQLAHNRMVAICKNVEDILGQNYPRKMLDTLIENINDVRNNRDVKWVFILPTADEFGVYIRNKIHNHMQKDMLSFRTAKLILTPKSRSKEGSENFVFAFTALGTNVTFEHGTRGFSRILFGMEKGQIMRDAEPREFGFITCATWLGRRVIVYGFLNVFWELISTFDPKIYLGIVVAYLVPCILLGVLYHGLLRKRIQEKYQIKWDPFTWGIRALILQPGDRRWNNKRFGFMICLVVPWLLMSIIISVAFRGKNLLFLLRPSTAYISSDWLSYYEIVYSNVTLVTDLGELAHTYERPKWKIVEEYGYLDKYENVGRYVSRNATIAFGTYMDRATNVASMMRGWPYWGGCGEWGKMKIGRVPNYRVPHGAKIRGWDIERWGDIRLIRKLKRMEAESGIINKWRDVLKTEIKPEWDGYNRLVWRANMRGNIRWVFVALLVGLATGPIWWIMERLWWTCYTKPKRRRARRKAKDGETGREISRIEPTVAGIGEEVKEGEEELDGKDEKDREGSVIKEDIVSAVLGMVEEEQRRMQSAPNGSTDVKVNLRKHSSAGLLRYGMDDESDIEDNSFMEVRAQVEHVKENNVEKVERASEVNKDMTEASDIQESSDDEKEEALGSELDSLETVSNFENLLEDGDYKDEYQLSPEYPPSPVFVFSRSQEDLHESEEFKNVDTGDVTGLN